VTKTISALFLAFAVVTAATAADAPGKVTMPNKNGAITFDHGNAKHKEQKCETCHGNATGGKIATLTKDTGHKMCLDCHKANKAAGAKADCKSCHSGPKA
jgi:predicted CXXCH cytochrome family protein